MKRRWTRDEMPSQTGQTFVVTGTNGLRFENALALACASGDVVISGRNPAKGAEAIERIRRQMPPALVSFDPLDLGNLASVSAFAKKQNQTHSDIDTLVNNAGVVCPPYSQTTMDGFDLQLGTNYLGYFAFTAQLKSMLLRSANPRVVTVSIVAARSQDVRTDLLHTASGRRSLQGLLRSFMWFLFRPAVQGPLLGLCAATSPEACGGSYYGPDRLAETQGYPTITQIPRLARRKDVASLPRDVSKNLIGVDFDALISLAGIQGTTSIPVRREV